MVFNIHEKEYFGIKLTDGMYDDDNVKYLKTFDIKSKYLKEVIFSSSYFTSIDVMSTLIERDEVNKPF